MNPFAAYDIAALLSQPLLTSWLFFLGGLYILYRLVWMLERMVALKPTYEPSALWTDLDSIPLDEIADEVMKRRRDAGFDIVRGNEACIVWNTGEGSETRVNPGRSAKKSNGIRRNGVNSPRRTPLAIVYIHGWSAGVMEHKTLVEDWGQRLGANVVCWRLTGHGGADLSEGAQNLQLLTQATATNLYADAADACLVGLRVSERVLLVGSSTGAALLTVWAARAPAAFRSRIAGFVGLSPAYALSTPLYPFMSPFLALMRAGLPSRHLSRAASGFLLSCIAGPYRHMAPINEEHKIRWTLRYPTRAVVTSIECIWEAGHANFKALDCPVVFVGYDADPVVSWTFTTGKKAFGALRDVPRLALNVARPPNVKGNGDFHHHVIGSMVVSSATVREVTNIVGSFLDMHCRLD